METTAKIFKNGRSQAVRIPQAFRFKGNEVKISKEGDKVILEPLKEANGRRGFGMFSLKIMISTPLKLCHQKYLVWIDRGSMYLLDTNIISYWMRGDRKVIDRVKKHAPSELFQATITLAEILYGIEKSPIRKKERRLKIKQLSSVLGMYSFDEAAAEEYAVIRAQLEREGRMISEERSTLIASIAVANKLIVATHNVKEFDRIGKLKVEDWAVV